MAKKLLARKGEVSTDEILAVDYPSSVYNTLISERRPTGAQSGIEPEGTIDWEDITPVSEGGGGSAFAHLTEDGTDLLVGDALIIDTTDGSLHWLDGAGAPNRSIKPLHRFSGDTGLVFDDTDGDGFTFGDPSGANVTVYSSGLSANIDDSAGTPGHQLALSFLADSVRVGGNSAVGDFIFELGGSGSAIRLTSIDGTAYDITVSNAGVVTATAA